MLIALLLFAATASFHDVVTTAVSAADGAMLVRVSTPKRVGNVTVSASSSSTNGTVHVIVDGEIVTNVSYAVMPMQVEFPTLEQVDGSFRVMNIFNATAMLSSVAAPLLVKVGGNFVLASLDSLDNVTFPSLRVVNENMLLRLLPALKEVQFPAMKTVWRTLSIDTCASLASMEMPSLETVGLHLLLSALPTVTNVTLPSLVEVRWDFIVRDCRSLSEINALKLETVGEDLTIARLPRLRTLQLPQLKVVGEDCEFYELLSLEQIVLPSLERIGEDLEIRFNPRLREVLFPQLVRVAEDVEVANNARLATIQAPELREVNEDLELHYIPMLANVTLPSLSEIRGNAVMASLPSLESLDLPSLVTIHGAFKVFHNDKLVNLTASELVSIGIDYGDDEEEEEEEEKEEEEPDEQEDTLGRRQLLYRTDDDEKTAKEKDDDDSEFKDIIEGSLAIAYNPSLPIIAFPSLERLGGGANVIAENHALRSLELPNLLRDIVWVHGNSEYSEATAPAPERDSVEEDEEEASEFTVHDTKGVVGSMHDNMLLINMTTLTMTNMTAPPTNNIDSVLRAVLCSEDNTDADEAPDDPWLRAYCNDVPWCIGESIRLPDVDNNNYLDNEGCIDLSKMLGGVERAAGSITLSSLYDDGKLSSTCIVTGTTLKHIDGCLTITRMSRLESIDLRGVESIGQSLFVSANGNLTTLNASTVRDVVNGEVRITDNGEINADLVVDLHTLQTSPLGLRVMQNLGAVQLSTSSLRETSTIILMSNVGLVNVSFPSLSRVGVFFFGGNDETETVHLPSLMEVFDEDIAFAASTALREIDVPMLMHAAEDVELFYLASIEVIAMPSLETVDEDFEVHASHSVHSVLVPKLVSIGEDLEIFDNWRLKNLDISSLESVDEDFETYLLQTIEEVRAPSLVEIGEDLLVFGNPHLALVEFPALQTNQSITSVDDALALASNASLTCTDPLNCTDAYYLYARENDFDFEENAIYLDAPHQFRACATTTGHGGCL